MELIEEKEKKRSVKKNEKEKVIENKEISKWRLNENDFKDNIWKTNERIENKCKILNK